MAVLAVAADAGSRAGVAAVPTGTGVAAIAAEAANADGSGNGGVGGAGGNSGTSGNGGNGGTGAAAGGPGQVGGTGGNGGQGNYSFGPGGGGQGGTALGSGDGGAGGAGGNAANASAGGNGGAGGTSSICGIGAGNVGPCLGHPLQPTGGTTTERPASCVGFGLTSPTGRDSFAVDMSVKMPRELTDITDEVRDVPPPPVPEVAAPYSFRLALPDADAEMISEWMNRPHLAATWRYDRPASPWHRHLSIQLDGNFSRPLICSLDGKDFGYVELYRAAKDYIATRYEAEPYDLGLHAAIADLTLLNKGHAQYVLPQLVASAFDLEPQCHRMMFDTEYLNAMGRQFCERAGCVFLGEHDMPNRRIALYVLPRSPEHIPRLRNSG